MTLDHRQAAQARIGELLALLQSRGGEAAAPIVAECEALQRAVAAFHMEGIRFRIFNVDRLLRAKGGALDPALAAEAIPIVEDTRRSLEAAGFHTRSHQAPTT
jgi:hypothetical protein